MDNKNSNDFDCLKIIQNKKITKNFDADQLVIMSATVVKINHVNKRQERAFVVTNKNVINIASPNSILPNRIKRKIPLIKINGITASRYGNQIVLHIDGEADYRFFTANLKNRYLENIVISVSKITKKAVKLYWYDDLALEQYTTTIIDLKTQKRKPHKVEPILVDEEYLKKSILAKPQSKLIFKGSHNENIQNFQEFDIIKVLGRGAYGKVMLCKHQKSGKYYAVKSMRKQDLIEKDSLIRTKTERFLLEKVNHPFLVNLEYAFQTKEKIFLIMKFYRGGQMFSKIRKDKKFTQKRAKFYAAQVFLAIEYLHSLGFIYRDLKPENILFDMNGYIRVSDYGLAKELKRGQRTDSLVGTASYLSPEVILSQGYYHSVDWWSLGVLIFEMLFSGPPFYCKDSRQMFNRIVNKQLQFPKDTTISPQCRDFLRGLLVKYPHKRLGHQNSEQIRNHPWFRDIDWNALLQMKIAPDYVPQVVSDEDVSNFLDLFTNEEPIDTIVNFDLNLLKKFEQQFQGFDYRKIENMNEVKRLSQNPEFYAKMPTQVNFQTSLSAPNFFKKQH